MGQSQKSASMYSAVVCVALEVRPLFVFVPEASDRVSVSGLSLFIGPVIRPPGVCVAIRAGFVAGICARLCLGGMGEVLNGGGEKGLSGSGEGDEPGRLGLLCRLICAGEGTRGSAGCVGGGLRLRRSEAKYSRSAVVSSGSSSSKICGERAGGGGVWLMGLIGGGGGAVSIIRSASPWRTSSDICAGGVNVIGRNIHARTGGAVALAGSGSIGDGHCIGVGDAEHRSITISGESGIVMCVAGSGIGEIGISRLGFFRLCFTQSTRTTFGSFEGSRMSLADNLRFLPLVCLGVSSIGIFGSVWSGTVMVSVGLSGVSTDESSPKSCRRCAL